MKNRKQYLISYLSGIFISVAFCMIDKVHDYLEDRYPDEKVYIYTEMEAQKNIKRMEPIYLKTADSSFDELAVCYTYTSVYQLNEMLSIAIIMANKYNYGEAYYLTYSRLLYRMDSGEKIDSLTSKISISYLKAAAKLNNKSAQKALGEYYIEGKFVRKDTILGNKLLKEYAKHDQK